MNKITIKLDKLVLLFLWAIPFIVQAESPVRPEIGPRYIINKTNVVYMEDTIRRILHPDMETFRIYTKRGYKQHLAFDKNGVYFRGQFMEIDTTGLEIVGTYRIDYKPDIYVWKNKSQVFYEFEEMRGVDAQTFYSLGNKYFKDTNGVYYINKKIMDADPLTFSADYSSYYAYDKNYIYKEDQPVYIDGEKAQPVNDGLWKTSKLVYKSYSFGGSADRMDASTLKKLSGKYSMDKNAVYYQGYTVPIPLKNFDKIRVFENFITDGEKIYNYSLEYTQKFNGQQLDAKSFGVLPYSNYLYDKNGIYFAGTRINKNTNEYGYVYIKIPFTYTYPVKDKDINIKCTQLIYNNQVYDYETDKVYKNLSPTTLSLIKNLKDDQDYDMVLNLVIDRYGGAFAKNKDAVYYVGYRPATQKLTGVDVQTFEDIKYTTYCKDKNSIFYFDDRNKKFYPIHRNTGEEMQFYAEFALIGDTLFYRNKALTKPFGNDIELFDIMYSGEAEYRKLVVFPNNYTPDIHDIYYVFKDKQGYWRVKPEADSVSVRYLGDLIVGIDLNTANLYHLTRKNIIYSNPNYQMSQEEKDEIEVSEPIYDSWDEAPEFPGREIALMDFIKNTLQYPDMAKRTGLEGTVYVEFIVERDGSLTQIRVLRRIGSGCDEEAIRIVKSMPKWKPAKRGGEAVRVYHRLPIKFQLQ